MSLIPLAGRVDPRSFFFDSADRFNGVRALQEIEAQRSNQILANLAVREATENDFNSRNARARGLDPGAFLAANAPTVGGQLTGFNSVLGRNLGLQRLQANQLNLNQNQSLASRFGLGGGSGGQFGGFGGGQFGGFGGGGVNTGFGNFGIASQGINVGQSLLGNFGQLAGAQAAAFGGAGNVLRALGQGGVTQAPLNTSNAAGDLVSGVLSFQNRSRTTGGRNNANTNFSSVNAVRAVGSQPGSTARSIGNRNFFGSGR